MEKLIERGHRRIAALIPSCSDHSISELRYNGYRDALRDHGIAFDPDLVMENGGCFGMPETYQGMRTLLERGAGFTAAFVLSDTTAIAAIKALEAFKDGHVILLAGGHDKMTGLDDLMEAVKAKTDALILLGEARQRFCEAAKKHGVQNIIMIDGSFEDAVNKAYSIAKPPEVVLLSPACSSYDMFANFPERGRVFKKLVRALAAKAEEEKA